MATHTDLRSARKQLKDCIAALDKAQRELNRVQTKRDTLHAEAEAHAAAHEQRVNEAREALALAIADDGNTDKARREVDKARRQADESRSDVDAVEQMLEKRKVERNEARRAKHQAERQYWKAVAAVENAKFPDGAGEVLRRVHAAEVRADADTIPSFSEWLMASFAGDTNHLPETQKQLSAEYEVK